MSKVRGRPRIRTDEETKEFLKLYDKEYINTRKATDAEYYKVMKSRAYYRSLLKNMSENDPKFQTISQKIDDLTTRFDDIKASRTRYARLGIADKVRQKINNAEM